MGWCRWPIGWSCLLWASWRVATVSVNGCPLLCAGRAPPVWQLLTWSQICPAWARSVQVSASFLVANSAGRLAFQRQLLRWASGKKAIVIPHLFLFPSTCVTVSVAGAFYFPVAICKVAVLSLLSPLLLILLCPN